MYVSIQQPSKSLNNMDHIKGLWIYLEACGLRSTVSVLPNISLE